MKAMNALAIAHQLTLTDEACQRSIVVLDLRNDGSSQRWAQQFPSMDGNTLDMIDEITFLDFHVEAEAIARFSALIGECAENGTGGLVSGTITLVRRFDTLSWDLSDRTRPVFEGTHAVRDEPIVERI